MARYFLDTSIYPTVPSMPIEMPYPRVIRVEGDLTPRSRIPSLIDPQDGISLQEALQQVANNTASSNATGEKSNTPLLLPTACDKNHGVAHAPAVSTLHILRGPQAGDTFPIPRGTTTLGRASTPHPHATNLLSKTSGGHLQIRDPFLQPIHGAFHVDSAGIHWAPVDSAETRPLTWNTPFCLGSLRPPHSAEQSSAHFSLPQADRTKNVGIEPNPFEPVSVTPPPPRKLTHILLSICLPILVGLAIALLTGMWFLLLMSVASSLLMLLHFFGGKARTVPPHASFVRQPYVKRSAPELSPRPLPWPFTSRTTPLNSRKGSRPGARVRATLPLPARTPSQPRDITHPSGSSPLPTPAIRPTRAHPPPRGITATELLNSATCRIPRPHRHSAH